MNNLFNRSRECVLNKLGNNALDEKDTYAHAAAANDSSSKVCNDNFVLQANFDGECWHVGTRFDREPLTPTSQRTVAKPCIFIVLESPHVEEFKYDPPIPAAGKTGSNVIQSLALMLNNHCPKDVLHGTYSVAFVNAIQFQTSLGVQPVYFRDHVFREMWVNGAKDAFITRLVSYLKDGDILINGCTCGKTTSKQRKLREDVQVAIDESIKPLGVKFTEIRTEHPSVWGRIFNTANKHKTFADYSWKANSKLFKSHEDSLKDT
ncbi:hypothetical protein OTK49_02135 [Vibrio coralliirubri]|uniref:hypothetical protein n=1 Tax=Vibrio coralliirubri TaxID=1516159 RepID=UPI002284959C|nr:hypothetical protein [Vibrio coralliirubri]MCY9861314.1 hypothetical protein [Vibrio coralliirubri]